MELNRNIIFPFERVLGGTRRLFQMTDYFYCAGGKMIKSLMDIHVELDKENADFPSKVKHVNLPSLDKTK